MPNQRGSGSTWPKRRKTFRSGNYPLFAGGATFYFPDALSAAALPVPDAADRAVAEILEPQSLYPSHKTRKPHAIQPAPRPPGPTVSFYGRIWGMLYRWFRLQTSLDSPLRAPPARAHFLTVNDCTRILLRAKDTRLQTWPPSPSRHCRPFAFRHGRKACHRRLSRAGPDATPDNSPHRAKCCVHRSSQKRSNRAPAGTGIEFRLFDIPEKHLKDRLALTLLELHCAA